MRLVVRLVFLFAVAAASSAFRTADAFGGPGVDDRLPTAPQAIGPAVTPPDGGVNLGETDALERPFVLISAEPDVSVVRWHRASVRAAASRHEPFTVERFPLQSDMTADLALEPFRVTGPNTRFVVGRKGVPDRILDYDPSSISLFRGTVPGWAGSHVYLALGDRQSMGFVDLGPGAPRFEISSKDRQGRTLDPEHIAVYQQVSSVSLPPGVPLCGVVRDEHRVAGQLDSHTPLPAQDLRSTATTDLTSTAGLTFMELAIDTDYEYYFLFGDEVAAADYLISMYGAVSDIYVRDVNIRVELSFVRIWTHPNDLYNGPDPLAEFVTEWRTNMVGVFRDVAQLFSGRRNYPFGGQAYLSALCDFDYGYGVVGYAVGFFPDPSKPGPFSYDVPVTAHELGHNAGALHTHDYGLDTCQNPNTTPRRGPIMSYCGQTWSGMGANTDNYFHTFVRGQIRDYAAGSVCIHIDCNMNSVHDLVDIARGTSLDINGNGIPDECEDCDNNGVLDPTDIAGASDDDNDNGIPDECEPDCNSNGIPDDKDLSDGTAADLYGNGIPDECEADCNSNGVSDYTEIQADMPLDVDRNAVLDSCQDCDGDGVMDLEALASSHSLWIASGLSDSVISEFYATTGVLTATSSDGASALVDEGQDLIITPNGRVLVSSAADDRVMEFDDNGSYLGDFVSSGSGGLIYPTGLMMNPVGHLLVSSRDTDSVLMYNGTSGAPMGAFVASGAGGLVQPFGLTLRPNGNLLVTSATNEVLEYDGTTGAFVGKFIDAADNGTLDQPRGLTFKADGNLLVCSYGTDEVLEFDGLTGAPLGKWAQVGTATRITQDSPWGIRVGPNGHVFVSRTGTAYSSPSSSDEETAESHLTDARMFEYNVCTGLFRKTHIGGNDHGLFFATGFDFVPGWTLDCNNNQLPDDCDIDSGLSLDANSNGSPDECEVDCNSNGVTPDLLDLIPFGTSRDANCNFIPDECEIQPAVLAAPPHGTRKNRYISFDPNNPGTTVALEVNLTASGEFPDSTGLLGWAGEPNANSVSRVVDLPYYSDAWPSVLHLGDCEIVPVATYEIRATIDQVLFSDPLVVGTILKPSVRHYGDTVGTGTGALPPEPGFTGPNRVVNVTDVQAYILTAQGPSSPSVQTTWVDLHGLGDGSPPNFVLNVSDLQRIKFGFQGQLYTDAPDQLNPADCP